MTNLSFHYRIVLLFQNNKPLTHFSSRHIVPCIFEAGFLSSMVDSKDASALSDQLLALGPEIRWMPADWKRRVNSSESIHHWVNTSRYLRPWVKLSTFLTEHALYLWARSLEFFLLLCFAILLDLLSELFVGFNHPVEGFANLICVTVSWVLEVCYVDLDVLKPWWDVFLFFPDCNDLAALAPRSLCLTSPHNLRRSLWCTCC